MAVSEFQLALIGTGAVAVVAVWGYNSWQEYRQRKLAEKIFRGEQEDVLINESPSVENDNDTPSVLRSKDVALQDDRIEPRIEPGFGPGETMAQDSLQEHQAVPESEVVEVVEATDTITIEATSAAVDPANDSSENSTASEEVGTHDVEAAADEPPAEDFFDRMIEVGMALPPAASVSALQAAWSEANKIDFRKPVRWIARNRSNGEWTEIGETSTADADNAVVTIQLADRQGVIDADELKVFCHTAQAVAGAHGFDGDLPMFNDIMRNARALDDFCASVDIQIAIHIVSRTGQAFAGSKLKGMLQAAGLQFAQDGLFYLLDGDGKALLSVCNSGAMPFDIEQMRVGTAADVTFWLDVPRVQDGGRVFDIMVAVARQLAEALDGVLVDDKRNPLADNVLAGIRTKVIELQMQMATYGIPAGGRRALRLFA